MGNRQKQPRLINGLRVRYQVIGDAQGLRSSHTGIAACQYVFGIAKQQLLKRLGQAW